MTKKELELVVAELQAENVRLCIVAEDRGREIRRLVQEYKENYNGLSYDKGETEKALLFAREWGKDILTLALAANRAAYQGNLATARKATWELLGLFPNGQTKAKALEAARKAAATAKKEIDTSDLV